MTAIIDAHAQFGPGLAADSPLQPRLMALRAEDLIAILDRVGIDRAVVHAPRWHGGTVESDFVDPTYEQGNDSIAEGVARYPERLVGLARVDPRFGTVAVAELERCLSEHGFRGLYLDNSSEAFSYADLALLGPIMEVCAARGVPVMMYTGQTPSHPFQLAALAAAFPGVRFIMAHAGWRLGADALAAAELAPNLYLETSICGAGIVPTATKRLGVERVLFGTNIPFGLPEVEIRRIRRWGSLTDTQLELVLGRNVALLLGLGA